MSKPALPLPDIRHMQVALRPIRADDLGAWFDYLRKPQVHGQTSWKVESVDELHEFVWKDDATPPNRQLRFAIVQRKTDELIGTVGLHSHRPEHRCAELAYDLNPVFWGQGIVTAACAALLDWGHNVAGLIRIQATALESNARSLQVLQRCGFEREGLLRSYRFVLGEPANFWMYSHLPGEIGH